ncbi:MAG: DNA mismatch repair protein MutS [Flavobacteriaceae bacterium]|nr:MAG: DNA mismatch repair protein MutS [Flavobacteriaceae bacterium]
MKNTISKKVLLDLEFETVLEQVANFAISEPGKQEIKQIVPITEKKYLLQELALVNEYLASFENENRISNHYFETITVEIQKLGIENSFLEPQQYLKLATISETVNEQKKFLKKFSTYYPTLYELSEHIEFTNHIIASVKQIITSYGEVVNSASPVLKQIRKEIGLVRSKIAASFNKELSKAIAAGYLADIKETIMGSQRVLAVQAMYRRKINGSILGSSKSGSIVYMAPQSTLSFSRELQNLEYEEKQEIIKILKDLSDELRPFQDLFKKYFAFLTRLDVISAKAKYADSIHALLPTIVNEKKIYFKNAFHPILWLKNKAQKIATIPQTIELHDQQQIIVVSGPNAGGKSITLKTVGLLQLMLQSGLLIPVDERSETCVFDTILTDIGDNQSIENQLSTYSYRLKNMRHFLRNCNENTLFLIDEFGTGSDPELGGALAEIFLEEFYHKNALGIITTHYANLKILANELENVANANMQFNERTLEPLYILDIGQPGSSFTFEVAQKNGIPFRLINRAKKRIESEKIRLDKTISKLQKERNKLQKTSQGLEKQKSKGQEHIENLQEKEQKIQEKLAGFQELYDNNQRMLSLGRKINELLNTYFQTNNKKELTVNFNKWVAAEKTKYIKKNPGKSGKTQKKEIKAREKKAKETIKKIEKEVLQKVVKVRAEKKKEALKIQKAKENYIFNIHDRVRLPDGNAVGTIEKIEKKKAFINYGMFTTEVSLSKLELVEKSS